MKEVKLFGFFYEGAQDKKHLVFKTLIKHIRNLCSQLKVNVISLGFDENSTKIMKGIQGDKTGHIYFVKSLEPNLYM